MSKQIQLFEIPGLPLVKQGNKLGELIVDCCQRSLITIRDGDVFVIAQKVISKAEGSVVKPAQLS